MLTELTDLLLQDIPEQEQRRTGFLDIIAQNTRENTINDVYQYFLSSAKSPIISMLLMDSLLELIESAYAERDIEKKFDVSDYAVHREYNTGKGRIDLVIQASDNSWVIIIEVKVYHWLANDLKDYWNAFSDFNDDNKAGVVLSLEPIDHIDKKNRNFINITHEQLLNHARNKGLPHSTPFEQIVYFNDFVDNMNHLTKSNMISEEVLFYLDHSAKINKAIKTKEAAYSFVIDQFSTIASSFNWALHGNSRTWRHLWDRDNKATAYYAVLPEQVINSGGMVRVKLEIYSKGIPYKDEIWNLIKDDVTAKGLLKGTDGNKHYQHLACKRFDIESKDFSNMAEIVRVGIENDLEPIRKKIIVFLKERDAHQHR